MKTTLTQIGNSKGIILPAKILKEMNFGEEVFLEVKQDSIVITKAHNPREGWEESILAAGAPPDELLLGDFPNDFDEEEWVWEE